MTHPTQTLEKRLSRASDLLRCAVAVTYESGDRLSGKDRDLAFAGLHLIEEIKTLVDDSLEECAERQL